ncbi:MAG: transcriptional repressor, partial [Oscillospiraceae bacterium]
MEARHNKSKQRQAILDVLCASKEHPSAEMIFSALKPDYPSLSLGTVYRNLSFFQQQGLAVSVANVDGNMRYDACTAP